MDAAHEADVQRTIATALRERLHEWDLVWMPKLDWWSPFNLELAGTLKREGFLVNSRMIPFSSVTLPGRFDDYLNSMSANRRQQVRRPQRIFWARGKASGICGDASSRTKERR